MPPKKRDSKSSAEEKRLERYLKLRENREEKERTLLANLKSRRPELAALLESCSDHWGYEDPIYRFYHASFKVMRLRATTDKIVATLHNLLPEQPLNEMFLQIIAEGAGRESSHDTPRAVVEAFFHARYMLEMAVRYADLEAPPQTLPSGWAAFLYLFNLR